MTIREKSTMKAFSGILKFRLIRFFLIGGLNTAFSYGLYAFFIYIGLSYAISNFLALIAGIFFSFRTQGKFVFGCTEKTLFFRFIVVWAAIYAGNILFIRQLIGSGLDPYVSGALAIGPIAAISYVAQKFLVFRNMMQNEM